MGLGGWGEGERAVHSGRCEGAGFLGACLNRAARLQHFGALDARTVHEDILAAVVGLCDGGGEGVSAASAQNEVGRGVGSVQRCGGDEAQRCNGAEYQRRIAH